MILERLNVSGFRRFAAPYTFVPHERFTVIHAPNGTGKTTLLDALYYGLLERHTVTGEKARERFESAGRQLAPTINVDFAVNGRRYRLCKTFLGSKSASLQRWENGRYVPLKQGPAADDFVRELFCAELPGRGALEPTKHLGFAHVLWSPARASFDSVPDVAGEHIRAMLGDGISAVTDGERVVQERVLKEYAKYYTAGGAFATAADSMDIPGLQGRVAQAQTAVMQAREQYHSLERLTREYEDRNADAQRMEAKRTDLRRDLVKAKADAGIYAEFILTAERSSLAEKAARESYDRVSDAVARIATLRGELDEATQVRARVAVEIQQLENDLVGANQRMSAAQKIAEDAGTRAALVKKRSDGVTLAQSYVDARRQAESAAATLATYQTDAASLQALRTAYGEIVAPTRERLEQLREQVTELARLEATVAASALAIDIDAHVAVIIEVVTAERTGPLALKAGETAAIAAADDVVTIDIPGLGRIRARGADGAAKARKKAQTTAELLRKAWELYGTSSLPELAGRTERAAELARQISELERSCSAKLADRTIDALGATLSQAVARITTIEQTHAGWHTSPPDVVARKTAFDRELDASTDIARTASLHLTAEFRAKAALDGALTEAKARGNHAEMKLQTVNVQLSTYESDGLDDAARQQRLQNYAMLLHAACGTSVEVRAKIATFGENPTKLVARLELEEREAGAAFELAYGQAKMYLAQLDMQAKRGTYAKLGECEEHLALRQTELAGVLAQAAAIKCLRDAFDGIRSSRLERVVAPITDSASRYMNRIAGTPMGRIRIGSGFAPLGLVEHASELLIGIDSTLSSGEKEQIYLSTRLALAEVIADGLGRQLFVVDDAVTATDPNRLRRFITILEELSHERLQIIVTTADKSRYLGIAGAKHVDLAAELCSEAAA